ncbi:MAG: hypothetical protein JWO76_3461 [Nocardioides sp.]|nr:hypothetical protein [Nocardioides sp.]
MRRLLPAVLLLALAPALAGCSGADDTPETGPSPSATTPPAPTPTAAVAAPRPHERACYRLDFDAAVAPTNETKPSDCGAEHTSMTYAVGTLDTVVDGHLVAVDSQRVQDQVARTCPDRLTDFLGGTPDDLHLTMLRAVWFTPTVEESDAGADWYRCDVIALASDGELAPLTGRLAGVLGRPAARSPYGMCGTAEPGDPDFNRVICSSDHSWRAIRTVDFARPAYPGEGAARAAGQQPCEDAAREQASDTLNFRWGYEWPTRKQWDAGQTYGLCWIPD